jgi:hypothetical protein
MQQILFEHAQDLLKEYHLQNERLKQKGKDKEDKDQTLLKDSM